MKKRKAPVLLLSILVVLVGAVVIVGMRGSAETKPILPVDPVTQGSVQAPSAQEVGGSIAAATHAPKAVAPPTPAPQTGGPSIAVQTNNYGYMKPKPLEGGDTNSGWYRR